MKRVVAGLGTAAVFEVFTLLATQDKAAWAASPWREDPYHTVVSLAGLAAPILMLAILLRVPGRPTLRATRVLIALIGITLITEWIAVGAQGASRRPWAVTLLCGLIVTSALAVVTSLQLAGREAPGPDWLDDIVRLGRRIPLLRRWIRPEIAPWVRRRALPVFAALSLAAGALMTASQAAGERWTDPLLIAWMLLATTAAGLALSLIGNALIGFVARPPRSRSRRIAESSMVAGCLGILAAIAFHDSLWAAVGTGRLDSVPALVALTLGGGVAGSLATAIVLGAAAVATGRYERRRPRF
ncbi:MAG TPA: hypothetical protein VHC49_25540 [Mycobacteriales bacterium]|nr:hypothetical protein [Mycobacteriales bacterium]